MVSRAAAEVMPALVLLEGGEFVMGNASGRPDEQPEHPVVVRPFRAAVEPVSNREYAVFLESAGHAEPPTWHDDRFNAPGQPAVSISWHDASAYCAWLSEVTAEPFRLPTEAEREFAARGGLASATWPWGDEKPGSRPELASVAGLNQPHEPAPRCANGYGLRCMAENVHEWCSDWYAKEYYAESPREDPRGPASGTRRASRGGAWRHAVKFTPVAARSSLVLEYRYNDYGFRVYADA